MAESDDHVPGVATWRDYKPETDESDGDVETAVPEQPAADDKPKASRSTAKAADKPKED